MTVQALFAGAIGIAACVDDLRRRQIANWIPVAAFAGGLAVQTVEHGWRGLGSGLLGTVTGAGVFLIFYLLGGMGGGDVKLMAGFGALLGTQRLLIAALWTAGCGGLMALAVIAAGSMGDLWRRRAAPGEASVASRRAETIPYAPAIAAGVWLSLVSP